MSLLRFALVGCIGFIIDVLVFICCSFFLPVLLARGVAFWLAASSNWWCNRHFTFGASRKKKGLECGQYLCASILGFVPNWGLYAYLQQASAWAVQHPVLALVPGILVAMLLNYVLARCWVFARED
ncbi:MAG: GtrA family protein [Pseudomonadales bacterium]